MYPHHGQRLAQVRPAAQACLDCYNDLNNRHFYWLIQIGKTIKIKPLILNDLIFQCDKHHSGNLRQLITGSLAGPETEIIPSFTHHVSHNTPCRSLTQALWVALACMPSACRDQSRSPHSLWLAYHGDE